MSTTATRDGNDWILNGAKKWIGNASFADLIIIWARNTADETVQVCRREGHGRCQHR